MTSDHILSYWERQAATHKTSHWASWGDDHMIALETETIGAHIEDGMDVLDVGCANGFSALSQVARRNLRTLVGVDFAPSMIEQAIENKRRRDPRDVASFRIGDVRSLEFADSSFDLVYTTRVLINLPTWEEQKVGILECLRVVRPGGKVIISEAFWEPLMLLNAMRLLVRLPPLAEHDFNRYLKMVNVESFLKDHHLAYSIEDFSSVYYLGSRFLRELVTNPNEYPGYSNPVNVDFFELERKYSGGGCGIQQAYIVVK